MMSNDKELVSYLVRLRDRIVDTNCSLISFTVQGALIIAFIQCSTAHDTFLWTRLSAYKRPHSRHCRSWNLGQCFRPFAFDIHPVPSIAGVPQVLFMHIPWFIPRLPYLGNKNKAKRRNRRHCNGKTVLYNLPKPFPDKVGPFFANADGGNANYCSENHHNRKTQSDTQDNLLTTFNVDLPEQLHRYHNYCVTKISADLWWMIECLRHR